MISTIKAKLLTIGAFIVLTGCATTPFLAGELRGKSTPFEALSEADQTHYQLSLEYIESANYGAAKSKLERILENSPNFAQGHNALGVLYERRGQVTLAQEHFLQAMMLDPFDEVATQNYLTLRCYLKGDEALSLESEMPSRKSIKAPLLAGAGICALGKDAWQKAEDYAERGIVADKQYPENYYLLALVKEQRGEHLAAMAVLDQYNDLRGYSEKSAELGLRLSRALKNRGDEARYAQVLATQFHSGRNTQ